MKKATSVTVTITVQSPEGEETLMTLIHDFANKQSRMALHAKGNDTATAMRAAENALNSSLADLKQAMAGEGVKVAEVTVLAPTGRMDA